MKIAICFFIGFIFLISLESHAQSSRDSESVNTSSEDQFSAQKKAAKKVYQQRENQAQEEFEELMKANKKKYKKQAKAMEKPQYSDPSYFGHKRKPKKRSLKKRKMCKECGIVH